jgi:serine/threonine protein kinase
MSGVRKDENLGKTGTLADGFDSGSGSRRTPSGRPPGTRHTSFAPGARVGDRYSVLGTLGGGGMGEVYRARDHELDRDVALKIIRPLLADDATILERFRREVLLATQITHPNVLRVYDLGEGSGVKFLTMQLVEGEDLATRLRRERRLPWQEVVGLGRQITHGLAAAHARGVVHRDLKPRNVLVEANGHAYVADFGLATIGESGVTRSGELLGTPSYMAPEQVKSEGVDARADIYALGVVLYEALTGELPFKGATAFEIMSARLFQPPRAIRDIVPLVPDPVAAVVARCMEVDRARRYANTVQVAEALDGIGRASLLPPAPPSSRPSSTRSRRPPSPAEALGETKVSATVIADQVGLMKELFGANTVADAVASLPAPLREEIEHLLPGTWISIDAARELKTAMAARVGEDVLAFQRRIVRTAIERTLHTVWRFFMRQLGDGAIARRTPVLYSRAFNRGKLEVARLSEGEWDFELRGWPTIPEFDLTGLAAGMETVITLSGRRAPRVTWTRRPPVVHIRAT